MKVKEFVMTAEELKRNEIKLRLLENKTYDKGVTTLEEYKEKESLRKIISTLKGSLDAQPHVNVSFYIGFRAYYRSVIKIGKTYFHHYEKMTKSNGFRCIEEIPEITQEMKDDMLSDTYYY